MLFRRFALFLLFATASLLFAQQSAIREHVLDAQAQSPATGDQTHSSQLSGTVVDPSGAVIAGATVQVWNMNSTLLKTTQTDGTAPLRLAEFLRGIII